MVEKLSERQKSYLNHVISFFKICLAVGLLFSSVVKYLSTVPTSPNQSPSFQKVFLERRRRLTSLFEGNSIPTYMTPLIEDLASRKRRFDETPPEEIKYWFEYPGPLQVISL